MLPPAKHSHLLLPATEPVFVVGDPFHEVQVELIHRSVLEMRKLRLRKFMRKFRPGGNSVYFPMDWHKVTLLGNHRARI